jgi:hypothetical protein
MKLTEVPEIVTWPETHYLFIEKIGPFQNTAPQAWQNMHQLVPKILEHNKIAGYLSMFKIGPQIYRAGVSVGAEPKNLPEGIAHTRFKGGKYSRFVLTGLFRTCPRRVAACFKSSRRRKSQYEMISTLKIT